MKGRAVNPKSTDFFATCCYDATTMVATLIQQAKTTLLTSDAYVEIRTQILTTDPNENTQKIISGLLMSILQIYTGVQR